MAEQHVAFVGAVPANYDRHLGPILFHPLADDLAARLPGDRLWHRDRHRRPEALPDIKAAVAQNIAAELRCTLRAHVFRGVRL